MRRSAAVSDSALASSVADDVLLGGGTAIAAVVTAFFAEAAANPDVLLGPITILVSGVGDRVRAFDGRCAQPGSGAKRPRGFLADAAIPDAARIGVPCALPAISVALAYSGSTPWAALVRPALQQAKAVSSEPRRSLLLRIKESGAGAWREQSFLRPLLHLGGLSQGGTLTPNDFRQARTDVDTEASRAEIAGNTVCVPAWESEPGDGLGTGHVVLAADPLGQLAALAFRSIPGLAVPELELTVGLSAVPVERGVERVTPGTRLKAPAPIGIVLKDGRTHAITAQPAALRLETLDGMRIARDGAGYGVTA